MASGLFILVGVKLEEKESEQRKTHSFLDIDYFVPRDRSSLISLIAQRRKEAVSRYSLGLNVSVYLLLFDAMSRAVWERGFPKTRSVLYHSRKTRTFELTHYHAAGINSPDNWLDKGGK